MSQAPVAVRAVARAGVAPAPRPELAAPLPARRDPYSSGLLLLRLMLVQASALVGLAAVAGALWAVPVAIALVGLTVVAFARRRGRWWTQHAGIAWRYRRRRPARVPADVDPRLRGLHLLAPDLSVSAVGTGEGTGVGVARDRSGWYAVVAVDPDAPAAVPLSRLLRALTSAGQPGLTLQLVVHTEPGPAATGDPDQPSHASYAELQALLGPVPAERSRWVAVRLAARTLAEAVADGEPDESQQA